MPDRPETRLEGHGFSRVLDAEKAADLRIAGGRDEAAEILQAARAEERRIAARADRRLRRLHGDIQAAIERERVRMVRAFEVNRRELSKPPAPARIAAAARRLARRLAGIDGA